MDTKSNILELLYELIDGDGVIVYDRQDQKTRLGCGKLFAYQLPTFLLDIAYTILSDKYVRIFFF